MLASEGSTPSDDKRGVTQVAEVLGSNPRCRGFDTLPRDYATALCSPEEPPLAT